MVYQQVLAPLCNKAGISVGELYLKWVNTLPACKHLQKINFRGLENSLEDSQDPGRFKSTPKPFTLVSF